MISVAVWLASDEAKIFKFNIDGVQLHHMRASGKKHPAETQGRNHPKEGGDADRFFHEVAEFLIRDKGDRWLVMGPGLAKNHFQSHIDRHHAPNAKKIVGVEAMDKSTDGEIKNFAQDFFKKIDKFE